MELFGQIVVYVIMACAVVGCIASVVKPECELGQEFVKGIDSIGSIFLPCAGILASAPYLTAFVTNAAGPLYGAIGADSAIAATTFIANDMGGYQLAYALAETKEDWMVAMMAGYMCGPTIVFTIPVALKMLAKNDYKYLALGVMCGLLAIPFGVLVSCCIIAVSHPVIRDVVSTNSDAVYTVMLEFGQIAMNLVPLVVICIALALGLKLKTNAMIKGFVVFGRVMQSALKIVFVLVVVEYFTGLFSTVFGGFGFDPVIADDEDVFRALEVAGAIGMMLCGAFPMVWLVKRFLSVPLARMGGLFGLSSAAMTGLLAATANVLAGLATIGGMRPKDKVVVLAYSVCAAFLLGDHLSFTANFQPALILPVMAGKFIGGVLGIVFAELLAVKKAEALGLVAHEGKEAGVAGNEKAECSRKKIIER